MIPTRLLVALAVVPVGIAIVAAFVPGLVAVMVAFDLLLFGLAGLDLLLTRGQLSASRSYAGLQSVGRSFPVELTIANTGKRSLELRVTDDAPGLAQGLPHALRLDGGRQALLKYETRVDRRGEHAFGPITVRFRSPLGLWERQQRLQVEGKVRVYPDFAQLRRYGLQARQDEQRLPVRVRRRAGGENEFERLRPYVPGDPYRHIDWRATARQGQFVSREYGQEVNQNLILMIDAGRMMSNKTGTLSAFDHALNAAIMLGQVALRHGDRVGLLAFDREIRAWIPPRGGARAGAGLIRGTYDVFPSLHAPDYALAFRHLATRVRRRSLVVLLTSVVDEPSAELVTQLVQALGGRHLPVCVWVKDTDVEALIDAPATSPMDTWARAATADYLSWREQSLRAMRKRGALVLDCAPEDTTPELLSRYLEIKARRLL